MSGPENGGAAPLSQASPGPADKLRHVRDGLEALSLAVDGLQDKRERGALNFIAECTSDCLAIAEASAFSDSDTAPIRRSLGGAS